MAKHNMSLKCTLQTRTPASSMYLLVVPTSDGRRGPRLAQHPANIFAKDCFFCTWEFWRRKWPQCTQETCRLYLNDRRLFVRPIPDPQAQRASRDEQSMRASRTDRYELSAAEKVSLCDHVYGNFAIRLDGPPTSRPCSEQVIAQRGRDSCRVDSTNPNHVPSLTLREEQRRHGKMAASTVRPNFRSARR
jgi:hypothetical protein